MLGGKAWLAVDAVMLLAVPLATTTAYLAARRWIGSDRVRAWLAVAYGLLPVLTGAVAQGRLGTVAATILAPLAARSAAGLFGRGRRGGDGLDPRWRAAFGTGLWLAAVMALVPLSYPIAVASIGCVALGLVRSLRGLAQVFTAVALPPLLLLPWTVTLVAEPAHWLAEAGLPDPVGAGVAAQGLELALGRPGGPGGAPVWIGAAVLAGALVALTRRSRRVPVSAAWAVGLMGLAAAIGVSGMVGRLPQLPDGFVAWPGFAVVVVQGAALVAAAIAADGAVAALAGGSFGWRQPVVALVALAVGVVPLLGLPWWLVDGGEGGSLHRDPPVALPAYLVAAQLSPTRERTLVIDTADETLVSYQLVRDDGMRTGDDAVAPPPRDTAKLDRLVARILSAPTAGDVDALADYAVANVVLSEPADPRVARRLDALPSLVRTSAGADQALGWRLAAPTGRARLLPGGDGRADGIVLRSGSSTVAATLPAGPRSRTVALAETADPRWRATLDGAPLARSRTPGWGERFVAGRDGGELRVGYHSGSRCDWLLGQLAAIALALFLAAPGIRGSAGAHA